VEVIEHEPELFAFLEILDDSLN